MLPLMSHPPHQFFHISLKGKTSAVVGVAGVNFALRIQVSCVWLSFLVHDRRWLSSPYNPNLRARNLIWPLFCLWQTQLFLQSGCATHFWGRPWLWHRSPVILNLLNTFERTEIGSYTYLLLGSPEHDKAGDLGHNKFQLLAGCNCSFTWSTFVVADVASPSTEIWLSLASRDHCI